MTAYYNDSEPKIAAWLRELIAAGLIAPGDVDERSICDVKADDLYGYAQCHFFAGIGGWSYALRLAGWPDDRPVWTGSCPCQSFSVAGKSKGVQDPRDLWPHFHRLIRECRPDVCFGEQVRGAIGHGWLDRVCSDLEAEAYTVGHCVLGAHSVGAPHIRQRLYWGAERLADAECDGGGIDQPGRGPEGRTADRGAGGLGHPQGRGLGADRGAPGDARHAQLAGQTGGLADSSSARREGGHGATEPSGADRVGAQTINPGRDGDACRLGNAGGTRLARREGRPDDEQELPPAKRAGGDAGGLEHPQGDGREQGRAEPSGRGAEQRCGDFWGDSILIPCRDGKARRVESGSPPLAHGVPARVVRLRGYGNAIVPQVAAEFIKAYKMSTVYQPPFVYFGGKSRIAGAVWDALGNPDNFR